MIRRPCFRASRLLGSEWNFEIGQGSSHKKAQKAREFFVTLVLLCGCTLYFSSVEASSSRSTARVDASPAMFIPTGIPSVIRSAVHPALVRTVPDFDLRAMLGEKS